MPAETDFAVIVAGSARTVSGVEVGASAVTLTLVSAVGHAQAVTVNHTPGTDPIRDLWGNAVAGFTGRTVRNDSPEPALSLGDVTVAEDAGEATFTVTLDVVSGEAVSVDYATSDGTAETGSDYDEANGTLTIDAGETSGTFEVTVNDDTVGEGDEAFTVTLSNPVNATLATATATGTIADDEMPTLTIADASATEGSAVTFTVTLSPAADESVTVAYAASDGTATADAAHEDGADYTAPASDATLTIAAGQTSGTIGIATGDDTVHEADETFTVTLSAPSANAVLGTAAAATGTIENDDAASTDAALKSLTLKVGGSDVDLTPVFAAATHSYEADVANTAATVKVAAESSHGKATIAIGGDDDKTSPGEASLPMAFGDNTVTVTVTAEDGATTQDYTLKVTRALPALVWKKTVHYLGEDAGEVTLTATLTPASIDEVTVDYATQTDGGATPGEDFTAASGTLTFAAGETEKTVKVTILDDNIYEPHDAGDVLVLLSNPTGTAAVATDGSGTLLYMEHGDNDSPPTVTMENVTVAEDAGTMEFTLSLSHGVETDGLQYVVASNGVGGTATAGSDYGQFLDGAGAVIAIPSRATSASFSVSILDDDLDEDDETITIQWKIFSQYVADDSKSIDVTGTIADNDERGITVTPTSLTVAEGGDKTYTVVLTSKPTATVTVTPSLATGSSSDVTFNPSSLTFEPTDWETGQLVTVSAAHDDDADADTATIDHGVSGGDYGANGVTAAAVAVTVADDETASTAVALSVAPLSVDEDAGATTITVTGTLDGGTVATDTVVTVAVGASGDAAAEGTDYATVADVTLTIDAGETSGTATFTLTPTDDDVDEGDEALTVAGTTTGLTVAGTTLAIAEDDERGITVAPTSLTVAEGGDKTYTVVLDSEPTATVTVTPSLATGSSSDVTLDQSSLTFTTGNWETAQTVTVSAAQDADAEADAATIEHGVSGGDYGANGVTAAAVAVTVADDETASTAVALSVDPLSVDEDAGATTITVTGTLDGGTVATDTAVTVSVGASGDAAAAGTDYATVADVTLTIDAGETSGTATFSLTPTDDDVDEGDEALTVAGTTTATGLSVTETTLTIAEDDERGITVTPTSLTVAEGGDKTYTVVLTSKPTATVTVTPSLATGSSSDVTLDQSSLTFTTGNWETAQTVTVSAAQDADADADAATISHAVSGGDYGANGVTAAAVAVTVDDDDVGTTACPAGSDWCGMMTVASGTDGGQSFLGYHADLIKGVLSDDTIDYRDLTYTVDKVVNMGSGPFSLVVVRLDRWVPRGSVFNIGGGEFTADAAAETSGRAYSWTANSFDWVVGQNVAVSVKLGNYKATGKPTIAGVAMVDETLTVSTTGISDADGNTKAEDNETGHAYAYQWIRVDDGTETTISGATSKTYTLTAEDEGKTVKVRVSFTDDAGNSEEVESDAWPSSGESVAATPDGSVVTGLSASATATGVTLTWTAPTAGTVLGYFIEVSYDGGATWTVVEADTASTDTSYIHRSGMMASETRHYRVSAIDDEGAGPASAPAEASATIAAAGLTATGLTLQEAPDGMATIDLCWMPTDPPASALLNAAYRMREVTTSGPDDWGNEIWTSADKRAGAGNCASGIGVRVTGNLVAGVRYAFQLRASYENAWVLSDAAEATSVDTSRTLRTEVTAGVTGMSGDTLVPDTVCPAYDDPVTAEDDAGTFTLNIGFTTVDPAFVFYEEVTGFDPADDLTLENATAELAGPSYDRELGYRVRITPTNWGEDVAVSVPAGAVTHKDLSIPNQASAEFRRKTSTATSCAPEENPAATVDHVEILDEGASNHEWAAGERIRVRLRFYERMTVSTAGGVPTVTLRLGGDAVEVQAPYSSVDSNSWIAFDHVVTAEQGPVRKVQLVADSLALNGGEIASVSGPAAALGHPGATKTLRPPPEPRLTATWTKLSTVHPGAGNKFAVHLQFSLPATISARDLRNHAISITGGTIDGSWRVKKSDGTRYERLWRVRVIPDSHEPVTLSLTADRACSEQGAICTADGTRLSNAASVTISGSDVKFSVADTEVEEAPGAELAFDVTLDSAVGHRVKVNYRTVDGTAVAGEDYTVESGTLVFERGETSRTVSVPVLDDAHDEDSETMTLVLSDPWRGRIADGEAVGTITNTDLMPQAWLARFGRTVADQVMEAVEGRVTATRTTGTALKVAGRSFGGEEATEEEMREAEARLERLSTWFRDAGDEDEDEDALGLETRAVTGRDVLAGTSFALTEGAAESGFGGLWGRGTVTRFDGREDDLTLDGEVESALLGADFSRGRWAAGLAVGHSRAEGGYYSPQGERRGGEHAERGLPLRALRRGRAALALGRCRLRKRPRSG